MIEHDRVRLAPVTPTATDPNMVQATTFKIAGFNNKNVGRMLIVKSAIDKDRCRDGGDANCTNIGKAGKFQSVACHKEVVQLRKNGNAILTGRALDSSAQHLAMLNDVWGQSAIPPFQNGEAHTSHLSCYLLSLAFSNFWIHF